MDKAWFTTRIRERGLTMRRVASLMNIHVSALSRTLNGERRMQVEEVRKIAGVLAVPENEVLARLKFSQGGRTAEGMPLAASEAGHGGTSLSFMEEQVVFHDEIDIRSQHEDRIIPPEEAHPIFGCMKGTMTLPPDVDLTEPADPDWGRVYEN